MSRTWMIIALTALTIAVSFSALFFVEDPRQRELGLRVVPFVTIAVMFVNVLAALPLSLILARNWAWLVPWPVALVSGIAAVALTLSSGAQVGPWLEENSSGFVKCAVIRTAWCVALQVPWCLLAFRLHAGTENADTGNDEGIPFWEVLLTLAIAIVLPALYVLQLTNNQAIELNDLREKKRIVRALTVAETICQLGREERDSPAKHEQVQRFRDIRNQLRQEVDKLRTEVAQPLPNNADRIAVVQRARLLAQLDRLNDAEELIRPLADSDAQAMLLLANVLQDKEQWDASSDLYKRALHRNYGLLTIDALPAARATAVAGGGPIVLAAGNLVMAEMQRAFHECVQAYDGLAFNAQGRRDFAESERWYREAIEKLPPAKAYFHFQLGRHYEVVGRPGAAVEQFREAARLNPKEFGESTARRIEKLRTDTPACFLGGDMRGREQTSRRN